MSSRHTDPAERTRTEGSSTVDCRVRTVLEIEWGGSCRLDELDDEVLDFDIRFHDGTCHSTVTVDEGSDDEPRPVTKRYSSDICTHCPSMVFSSLGHLPEYVRHEGDRFLVRTFTEDASDVAELVDELRSVCRRVRLVRLSDLSDDERVLEDMFEIDVSVLTPKQRATFERAIERGYYEPTGGATLSDLADEFAVSKSALSQRLSRAEAKLTRQFFDG